MTGGFADFNTDYEEITISTDKSFRVAMLLPLTGSAARHGQGLKNASMLALEDLNNPNLILQYYDTQSTPSGARIAVENAVRQGARLIIGPLMSTEVQAIAGETIYQGVPVIAFSTSQEVLQPKVYTLGLLVEEQVSRIVDFAATQGRRRLALLIPDNSTGNAVAKAAVKAAQKNNVEIPVIGYYPPDVSDFSGIIKQMTRYDERHDQVLRLKSKLDALAKGGDAQAAAELKKLETKEGIGDVGFDMILIPESGARLTSAVSMLAYYDASYPEVLFLGTSIWETGKFNNESVMHHSLYPAVSRTYSSYFAGKYNQIFGERPSSLYAFSYDAVALASEIARRNPSDINPLITNPEGYTGINGAFRFFEDGTNQHSLDVREIRPAGDVVVDAGPRRFADDGGERHFYAAEELPVGGLPQIYGKNAQAAQIAIYGRLFSDPAMQVYDE